MKNFVIGDIHGGYKALIQCLERSNFDYKEDTLICLGDVTDGWPETPQCIEELIKIKNLIYVIGNHDVWLDQYLKFGATPKLWTIQGGQATVDAYLKNIDLRDKHFNFFNKSCNYYLDDKNRIFVHGGFIRGVKLEAQSSTIFTWDRTLANKCRDGHNDPNFNIREFTEVYMGHTTVNSFSKKIAPRNQPFNSGNAWLLDTGAGFEGVLTIMNIDTKEFWQSDLVKNLYPNNIGR